MIHKCACVCTLVYFNNQFMKKYFPIWLPNLKKASIHTSSNPISFVLSNTAENNNLYNPEFFPETVLHGDATRPI